MKIETLLETRIKTKKYIVYQNLINHNGENSVLN